MLFYDAASPAPNPRRVRIFLAEKSLTVPSTQLSIMQGEHKAPAFLAINPLGQLPALLLDDGDVLTETIAICRYFEALHPDPPLFGTGPKGMAEVDMWTRRVELRLGHALSMIWQHTHPFTARVVVPQYKEFGESNRVKLADAMAFLDASLADRPWLAGEHYSIADITLLTTLDFAAFIGVTVPEELASLQAWHDRASARPSAVA